MFRFRHIMYLLAILVPVISIITSPDFGWITDMKYGAEMVSFLTYLSRAVVAGVLLHVFRKLLNDYSSANVDTLLKKANNDPIGAGLAVVGLGIFTLAYAVIIAAIILVP